jgi:hypothetical protein
LQQKEDSFKTRTSIISKESRPNGGCYPVSLEYGGFAIKVYQTTVKLSRKTSRKVK